MAGIVTLNLNSAVWAKDDSNTDSKNTFRHTEMINGKVKTNDNGNIQSSDNGNIQSSDNGNIQSSNLDH